MPDLARLLPNIVLTALIVAGITSSAPRQSVAHTNNTLTVDSYGPNTGPAGTTTVVVFTYSIFHVGHAPAINNEWRVLLDGAVVASGTNVHPNIGSGNETYTETVNITVPPGSPPGAYTITIQTLHSPNGQQGCDFNTANGCRRQATRTFTIPDESDMSPDLSGLPSIAIVGTPYSATVSCTNAGPSPATNATCDVTGLPIGVAITSCSPTPPTTVAVGASIVCAISGTPTSLAPTTATVTTGADNDINGGAGTGGNNQISEMIDTAALEATKTASVSNANGNSATLVDAGDTVSYTITIANIGSATLTGVGVSDALSRIGGGPLTLTSGPTFISNSGGSPAGTLSGGETATFTASYTLLQADIDAGGVSNSATGTGTANGGPPGNVSDVSDDGDDGDGNQIDDPTITTIAPTPLLTITKLADDTTQRSAGETIIYTYDVTNTGNVTIAGVSVSDVHNGSGPAPTPSGETLHIDVAPAGDSTDASANASWDSLAPGDTVRFTGSYVVTQTDVDTLQ
ncbi:MAG: hypothetical protein AAFZ01_06320 [Pseudomonadota bacterium]